MQLQEDTPRAGRRGGGDQSVQFSAEPGLEQAQNAVRSGATGLNITLKDGVLKTIDNGSGAVDPMSLFVLADSNWPEEVEENQKPAGWGLFFLYSISEEVVFTSRV